MLYQSAALKRIAAITAARRWIAARRAASERRLDRLGRYLDHPDETKTGTAP